MSYVVSRLASNVIYTFYQTNQNNINEVVKQIKVLGKADVANKNTLITEKGAITRLSDDDIELLQQNQVFKIHKENGCVEIVKTENEAKKVIDNEILEKDFSAPITSENLGGVKITSENQKEKDRDIDDIIAETSKLERKRRK